MPKLVKPGFNDLKTGFPEIAAEAYGWDPETVSTGSNKKVAWICRLGHIWESTVCGRTSQKSGCPICSNKRVAAGFNDLQTKFPDIAKQAYGWDPSTVLPGTDKIKSWKCGHGHIWDVSPNSRTSQDSGCPICSNQRVLAGFNDLNTKFPEIAKEAFGWDPTTVISGSHQKKEWKCESGHTWIATVDSRTNRNSGCPICSNLKLLAGFNDLQTKFPEIAKEAFGWDPTTVIAGTGKKLSWKCELGHTWVAACNIRTSQGTKCPTCSNQRVLAGFNDLQTKFPEIAKEAFGWDPTTVIAGTAKKLGWECGLGHRWFATVDNRTSKGQGCPYCSNKKVLEGFNDLRTKFPEIAAEASGWDPSTIVAGSNQKKTWQCKAGHKWNAVVISRVSGSGCPRCAEYGFNPEKNAWFYLMERPGEQQLGITNNLDVRLRTHERNGWTLLDSTSEPASGQLVLETETAFKKWLKKEIGVIEGTTENWSTTTMEVQSLAELKARSGIGTDLF